MPEGDTIYRAARALEKALGGKVVTAFETGLAKLASVNDDQPLVGRVVERVEARGKWCLMYFSGDLILVTHMLMSGSWHVYRTGETWWMPRRAMRVAITVGVRSVREDEPSHPAHAVKLHERGTQPPTSSTGMDGGAEAPPLQGGLGRDSHPAHAVKLHERGTQPLTSSTGMDGGAEAPPLQGGLGRDSNPAHAVKLHERGTQNSVTQTGEGFVAVAFNVPVAEFHTARSLERYSQVPKLGPDILSDAFTVEKGVAALRERAATHPEDEIAVVLLNQRVMAGLGNVYKSEVAFAAGVNPFRRMSTVTGREMEVMAEFSQRYMKANVNDGAGDGIVTYSGNRRTTHSMDRSDRLWVYGRQGQECRRCGALVQMRKQGEQVRSTYWCPGCQPWVAAEGQSGEAPVGRQVKVLGGRKRVGC